MYLELAATTFLVGDFIYHRWFEDKHEPPRPDREIQVPRTEDGTPIPLIYGRCRVRSPILAWAYVANTGVDSASMRMLFVLGAGMNDSDGTSRVHGMWDGEHKTDNDPPVAWGQSGDGGPEATILLDGYGRVETLNGNSSQVLAEDGDTTFPGLQPARTWVGRQMIENGISTDDISGYRGYICAYLFELGEGSGWLTPLTIPAYSFEASSYASSSDYPGVGIYAAVGPDSNPINVIYDLLTADFGRLGLDPALIDMTSFREAAVTLYTESHGYSMSIEGGQDAQDLIKDVLVQVDGVMYDDHSDGKVHMKLVRNDYDPNAIMHIHKDNCIKLDNLAMGGWTGIPNKIRVSYTNRENDYRTDSVTAQNLANAVGQDGIVREEQLNYPGCSNEALALRLAERELAARSRPLIKCRAMVDRSFLRVNPGDAVKVTWTNPDISGIVFRVASVNRGTLEDGAIGLDLIQDFFYVYRNQTPKAPHFGGLGDGALTQG